MYLQKPAFLGCRVNKQDLVDSREGIGEGELGVTELNTNSPPVILLLPLCIVYIILHHVTLYASHIELTLFLCDTLWGKCLQIDREFPCFDLPPLDDACVKNTPTIYTFLPTLILGFNRHWYISHCI